MANKPARQKAEKRGRRAETLAAWYLRAKGYSIIRQRQRTPKGEIDIIARRGSNLVFVEVKARRQADLAVEAVTPYQRRRIVAAALFWISGQNQANNLNYRFDIILVSNYLSVTHIENAFDEGGR